MAVDGVYTMCEDTLKTKINNLKKIRMDEYQDIKNQRLMDTKKNEEI